MLPPAHGPGEEEKQQAVPAPRLRLLKTQPALTFLSVTPQWRQPLHSSAGGARGKRKGRLHTPGTACPVLRTTCHCSASLDLSPCGGPLRNPENSADSASVRCCSFRPILRSSEPPALTAAAVPSGGALLGLGARVCSIAPCGSAPYPPRTGHGGGKAQGSL